MAIPLDAHLTEEEEDHQDMDDRALQALMEGARPQPSAPAPAPTPAVVHTPTPPAPSVGSPKGKGRKMVDDHVACVIECAASNNLVPDVVLELEESEQANKRGHVLIAIDNPNPDLDIKILVRTLAGRMLVYC